MDIDLFNPEPEFEFGERAKGRIEFIKKLPKTSHIHILGICGTGTGALAALCSSLGYKITGSDKAFYPPMGDFVKQHSEKVYEGYAASNVQDKPDIVVIGNASSRGNEEIEEVLRLKLPFCSMPEMYSALYLYDPKTISIVASGTHGKTTTTALTSHVLSALGKKPGYFLGGVPQSPLLEGPVRLPDPKNPIAIFEGDEYDSAFFAKYSKFFCYDPNILIITNIEFDHGDIYQDLAAVEAAFIKLLISLDRDDEVIACSESESVHRVIEQANNQREHSLKVLWYGTSESDDIRVLDRKYVDGTQYISLHVGEKPVEIETSMSGAHNALNIAAVTGVCSVLGEDVTQISNALLNFAAVKRRQQILFDKGVTLIEDFAHHPTEVAVTLQGISEKYEGRRLFAVFEPRSNTARKAFFFDAYADALRQADLVCIKEVADAGYSETGISVDALDVSKLSAVLNQERETSAASFLEVDEMYEDIVSRMREGDVVLVMSNGSFEGLQHRLLQFLEHDE